MTDKMQSPKAQQVYRAVLTLANQGADLHGMRVQQIADAAGMGKGTLYEYFSSKEEILRGTLSYCLSQEVNRLTACVEEAEDFTELTRRVMDYIQDLVGHRFAVYELVMRVLQHGKPNAGDQELLGPDTPFAQALDALLGCAYQRAVQAGMDPHTPKDYFDFCIISVQAGFAAGLRRNGKIYAETLRQDAVQLLSRGLGVTL